MHDIHLTIHAMVSEAREPGDGVGGSGSGLLALSRSENLAASLLSCMLSGCVGFCVDSPHRMSHIYQPGCFICRCVIPHASYIAD